MNALARHVARGEALENRFAEVAPLPVGAASDDYWTPVPGEGDELHFRTLAWPNLNGEDMVAAVMGVQFSDSRLERHINVDFDDIRGKEQMVDITAARARGLAALLLAVVDQFDELDKTDR